MKPRHTIDLSAIEIERLNEIAGRVRALACAGPRAGKPSWRALVREIAAGRIACRDRLKGGAK